jgi:peptidyl-prolyl cis-trans isomerase B (cyclophilin B)
MKQAFRLVPSVSDVAGLLRAEPQPPKNSVPPLGCYPFHFVVTSVRENGRFCGIMKFAISICACSLALGLVVRAEDSKKETDAKSPPKDEVAVIKTTEGDMVVQFWPEAAPKTVENFKALAKKGFYDGTAFHRIIKGFMIQGGDPNTKDPTKEAVFGQGGPGYSIKAEFNNHLHQRGVISMARSRDPNSAGSQFFICDGDAPNLDHQYTAFGKLIKGEDVLRKIADTPVVASVTGEPSKPTKRIEIKSILITSADSPKPDSPGGS